MKTITFGTSENDTFRRWWASNSEMWDNNVCCINYLPRITQNNKFQHMFLRSDCCWWPSCRGGRPAGIGSGIVSSIISTAAATTAIFVPTISIIASIHGRSLLIINRLRWRAAVTSPTSPRVWQIGNEGDGGRWMKMKAGAEASWRRDGDARIFCPTQRCT